MQRFHTSVHPIGNSRRDKSMLTKPRATTPGDLTAIERTVPALRDAAARCAGCDLYKNATQTVFGEGPQSAPVMLVGEQPGDAEDLAGRPFVGPAGKLLGRCLAEAGIDRAETCVTNIVKHFKWVPRGPRRIHSKPGAVEIEACFPWLEAEIGVVAPRVVVALGATAAQALFGKAFRVTRDRGRLDPLRSHRMRSPRCIPRRCCALRMRRPGAGKFCGLSRIFARLRRS
jgi:DNA polymerase